MGTDQALKEYPEIFKKYFGTVVPPEDNKFAALNAAVWSGGSFVYVPKGVEVPLPLQAYFRINGENTGQFERTLIVVDEGAKVHYIEGCTAPIYATDSLHAAVVEVIALPGANVRYTTIQNWSNDVYNLVTKRAHAHENSRVEWIDANTGSRLTMKYPAIYLRGEGATADIISVAVAGKGQHQDTGAKAVHLAPNTRSRIVSKSVSKDGGRATYRGSLKVAPGSTNVVASVRCDALMLDDQSRSDTYPYIDIQEDDTTMSHEATVGKVSAEQVFYLMSRGLTENEATNLIVQGFLEVFTKELPMEYAIEFNRLVKLEMEGRSGDTVSVRTADRAWDIGGGERTMATAVTNPRLTDEQLADILALTQGSDSVELKLSINDADRRATINALGLDPLQCQIRQVYFFDTPDLKVSNSGVVVRARRVQGRGDDSTIKLGPSGPRSSRQPFVRPPASRSRWTRCPAASTSARHR